MIKSNYRPQRSCGKVIFSQASVKNSVRGGVSVWVVAVQGGVSVQGDLCPGGLYTGGSVSGRAVRILLECILVIFVNE